MCHLSRITETWHNLDAVWGARTMCTGWQCLTGSSEVTSPSFSPLFSPSALKAHPRKAVFCLRVKFSPPLWVGWRKSLFSPLTNSPLFCQASSGLINMQQGDFSPLVFLSLSKGYLIKCESAECNKGTAPQSSFISIREASRLSH